MVNKKLREKLARLKKYPFVSVCTPTFNRRPFIKSMIECFNSQDYPKDRLEWIIIDDGTDKIEDLVKDIKEVKYFKYDTKMSLGKKRNLLHEKSSGAIIVYMDDDDYYPPDRVSHAVQTLIDNPKALCAGSSEIYIYFNDFKKMYQFGPYGPNHATAGTFAFKRELLKDHVYEDNAALAEEKAFLKNYTVPFVQLDPLKTILVFAHKHNTFDKSKLIVDTSDNSFVKESNKTVDMFISNKNKNLKDFYMNKMDSLLKDYDQGLPFMKPDVIKQTLDIEESRRKANDVGKNPSSISMREADGTYRKLSIIEVSEILQSQQKTITGLINNLKTTQSENEKLNSIIKGYKDKYDTINDAINPSPADNLINSDIVYY